MTLLSGPIETDLTRVLRNMSIVLLALCACVINQLCAWDRKHVTAVRGFGQ